MEPEVGELLDQPLVGLGDGERCLDASPPRPCGRRPRGRRRAARRRTIPPVALRPLGDDAPEPRREARLGPGVARRPSRVHPVEKRVSVAVVADLLDGHGVSRRRSLVPELLARAAPEPRLAGLPCAAQRLRVRVGEHQDAIGLRVLDDHRGQRLIGHPASSNSSLSSGSRSGRSCTIDAIKAASAPTSNASARWRAAPAPPDAITGTSTAATTAPGQLQVVALPRPVGIDRREQDLVRPPARPPRAPSRPRRAHAALARRG